MDAGMDVNDKAATLLAYLGRRITAVVGNNAPAIAGALGLTVPELESAMKTLVARGLATETPMEGSIRRWGVTEEGLTLFLKGCRSDKG
jgi:hypothetical protein